MSQKAKYSDNNNLGYQKNIGSIKKYIKGIVNETSQEIIEEIRKTTSFVF